MKKVALLGGAFDPIHKGHLQMAWETSFIEVCDEVWIIPCYEHIYGKQMESGEHRLAMCNLLGNFIKEYTGVPIIICDYEIKNKVVGKTYDILERLQEENNDVEFSIIIGQDNADSIQKWYEHEAIIHKYPFIVFKRNNGTVNEDSWYNQHPHLFLEHHIPNISSTNIRNNIKELNLINNEFTLEMVVQYIKTNGLYGYKK